KCYAMDSHSLSARDVQICEISCKEKIVGLDGGAQKQRALIPKPQRHFRQISRSFIKDSLLAQALPADIAEPVKNGKHGTVFQYPGAVITGGGSSRYVVLLGEGSFIQFRTP